MRESVGPDVCKFMKDKEFEASMTTKGEKEAWIAFKDMISRFLGNNKDPDWKLIIKNIVDKFQAFCCLKIKSIIEKSIWLAKNWLSYIDFNW